MVEPYMSNEETHVHAWVKILISRQFPFLIPTLYGNNSWPLFNLIVEVRNWSYYILSYITHLVMDQMWINIKDWRFKVRNSRLIYWFSIKLVVFFLFFRWCLFNNFCGIYMEICYVKFYYLILDEDEIID